MNHAQHLDAVIDIAIAAGKVILEVYNQAETPEVDLKQDSSPITAADWRAHELITSQLAVLTPEIPILSEEAEPADYATRQSWHTYWLVDPLDGTREFVQRNGEFTVNIARIEDGRAVLGVVHVPVSGVTYSGAIGTGAFVQRAAAAPQAIHAARMAGATDQVRVVASRHHRDAALDAVLEKLQARFARVDAVSMGSSLKICLLAEGKADFYPRLAPTSEWDTAAAHAVLAAAGGTLVDTRFDELRYNQKAALLNPFFLAIADPEYDWRTVLAGCL